LMILVAGPYRSGTNDDAALIRKNVETDGIVCCATFSCWAHPDIG
jgi:hypothetical protein